MAFVGFQIFPASAQNRTMTGKVLDIKNGMLLYKAPLVVAKGTKIGTQTDADGYFIFIIPTTIKRVSFSAVGFFITGT